MIFIFGDGSSSTSLLGLFVKLAYAASGANEPGLTCPLLLPADGESLRLKKRDEAVRSSRDHYT